MKDKIQTHITALEAEFDKVGMRKSVLGSALLEKMAKSLEAVYHTGIEDRIARRFPLEHAPIQKHDFDFLLMSCLIEALTSQMSVVRGSRTELFFREEKQQHNNFDNVLNKEQKMLMRKFAGGSNGGFVDNMGALLWEMCFLAMSSKNPKGILALVECHEKGLVSLEGADRPMNEMSLEEMQGYRRPEEIEAQELKTENAVLKNLLAELIESTAFIKHRRVQEIRDRVEAVSEVSQSTLKVA